MITISSKINHIGSIKDNNKLAFIAEDAIDYIKSMIIKSMADQLPSLQLFLEYRYNESVFTGKKNDVYVNGFSKKTCSMTLIVRIEEGDFTSIETAINVLIARTNKGLEVVKKRLIKNNINYSVDAILQRINGESV
jgi:hypothetical protein